MSSGIPYKLLKEIFHTEINYRLNLEFTQSNKEHRKQKIKNIKNLLLFFCLFALSRAPPTAHGGSQARGLIGALTTGLRHSHNNTGSKLRLRPTPQLTAILNP